MLNQNGMVIHLQNISCSYKITIIALLGGKSLTYNFSILGCRRYVYKYIQWQLTEYFHMESYTVHRL